MKNIFVFYAFILIPIFILVIARKNLYINSTEFFWLMVIYVFIYHPALAGLRLVALNKIDKSQYWKTFIPFWNWRYYGELFFTR